MNAFKYSYFCLTSSLPCVSPYQLSLDRIEDMSDAVIALLESLGIDRFILLGHSMGGMIAQDIAFKYQDRVEKLVLYGTGPLGIMPNRFESIQESRKRLLDEGVEKTIKRIGSTWFLHGENAPRFSIVTEIGQKASLDAALSSLDAMMYWDGRKNLVHIKTPTLILWGDADKSYRWPQVETLWSTLENSRLSVVQNTAHATHLEKPKLFHAILDDFFADNNDA